MAAKKTKVSRNPDLISGIGKFSRSKMYHKRGLWAIKAKHGGAFPRHDKAPVEETMTSEKPPKFYPADDVKKPLVNKRKARPTKLRSSISPGTVLIILAGRFKGKRVVFLKQLTSGLLLVTGNSRKSYHWRHCLQAPAHRHLLCSLDPVHYYRGLVPDYLKHLNDERFCSYKN